MRRFSLLIAALGVALLTAPLTAAPARASILDDLLPWFSKSLKTEGLSIGWGGTLTAKSMSLMDSQGAYATFNGVKIVWSPLALIHKEIKIDALTVADADVARLPASSGSSSSGGLSTKVDVQKLGVGRLTIEKPVAGVAAALSLDGNGYYHAAEDAGVTLAVKQLDAGGGDYEVTAKISAQSIAAHVIAKEPAGGLVAGLAGLPQLGAIDLTANVEGPRDAVATTLALTAGQLHADANGTVNLTARSAVLHVVANAPAMQPRPDISWSSISLNADVSGPFDAPTVSGRLNAAAVRAAGGGVRQATLDVNGNKGDVHVAGQLDGVTLPGKQPDLLAAAPLRLTAEAKLQAPGKPVTFALSHPLLDANGTAEIATETAALHLTLPDLAPLAAVAGQTLQGHAALQATAARQNEVLSLTLGGTVAITGGTAPAPALIGEAGRIDLAAQMQGSTVNLTRLAIDGADVSLSANGSVSQQAVDLTLAAALPRLAPVDPRLEGALQVHGHVTGPTQNLGVDATLAGDVSAEGQSSGPFTAHLVARGVPGAPTGQLTAQGALLGAPIDVALAGGRSSAGAYHLTIDRADWKSLSAGGSVNLPAGAKLPQGDVHLTIGSLADFSQLIGKPLTGSANASLNATEASWHVQAQATDAGEAGTASVAKADLQVAIDHPSDNPSANGTLEITGLKTGKISGSAKLVASGPQSALGLKLTSRLANLDGSPATIDSAGVADAPGRALTLNTMNVAWKGQRTRLLNPVRFDFAQGLDIQNLRLGLDRAVIAVNGRASPTLDLTASIHDLPASLASVVSPTLKVGGTLNAEAQLRGSTAAPTGRIRAQAAGLRLDTEQGRALPPANVTAAVDLAGNTAKIDVAARAGASHVTLTGQAGLSTTAPLDLHADGLVDVAQADPMLPAGQRAAGHVTLAAAITGTASRPDGTVRIGAHSVRLLTGSGAGLPPANLTAIAQLNGGTARIESRLTAGASHVSLTGTAGLAHDAPIDLRSTGTLDLAMLNPVLLANGEAVQGRLAIDTTIAGTTAAPRVSGGATLTGGDVRDYAQGAHLSDITARLVAEGNTLRLVSFAARAGNGNMSGSGTVGILAPNIPVNLVITARNATPIAGDVVNATLNADLSIAGELEGRALLGGRIFISHALVQVPEKLPASVVTIPVRTAGQPPPKPQPPSKMLADLNINLTVVAPQQIFIRGRGLNAELGGTIRITGTTANMLPSGGFKLIRGNFNLVGNTLDFTSGDIDFNGASISNPALNLVATSISSTMTATLTVGGTARDPKITLSSVPPLPQDQILAQLLFHTNSGALSPFQLASIAAGLAQISGQGGGFANPLQGLQNTLGLDQLGVGSGPNGQATLQAGRYISRRVYVGAQQATGGAGAQATVQVDLTRGLKLNATAGSGETTSAIGATGESTGASVGLTYGFQY